MVSPIEKEAKKIVSGLQGIIPTSVDGKEAILQMKNEDSRNWRQMEWIGFWFEHLVAKKLSTQIAVSVGPTFGNTTIDLALTYAWDLKVHPEGKPAKPMILNDCEAVDACIDKHSGFGFVVVVGDATYDMTGQFKSWHDDLKGGRSAYEQVRIARGAPSRRRKVSFTPSRIEAVFLKDAEVVEKGLKDGWLGYFQQGMRNSNGTPRRAKYQIRLSQAPDEVIVACIDL